MKKLFLCAAIAMFGFANTQAQGESIDTAALSEGSVIIEVNTGSWTTGSTAFSLTSIDGNTSWSVGAEAGYFIIENLALKGGLGFSDSGFDGPGGSSFNYKIGGKYYVISRIPVGVDYTGSSIKDFDENPSYLGVQAGYAWFIAPNVSVEPTLRYNVSMNDDFYESAFQALIGFAVHL